VSTNGNADLSRIDSELQWADTDRVVDQGTDCVLNKGMPSYEFYEVGAPQTAVIAADDFVVPAGKTIFIDQIHFATRWTPEPDGDIPEDEQMVEVTATVFHENTVLCRMALQVYPKPLLRLNVAPFRCFLSGARLGPSGFVDGDETYWLTLSSFTNDLTKPLMYWGFSSSDNGHEFLWKDPDAILSDKCPTWTDGTTCGVDTYGTDMCFRILGTFFFSENFPFKNFLKIFISAHALRL
jgi:hypothetical protein